MKNYTVFLLSFFVFYFATSQINTKDFAIAYKANNKIGDFISAYSVDGLGNAAAQTGVNYLWTIIDGKDTFSLLQVILDAYILKDGALKNLTICMKAYNAIDTFELCKNFTIYPYLHGKSLYTPVHFFYNDKNSNCKQDAGEQKLRLSANYTSKSKIYTNNIFNNNDEVSNVLEKDTYTITSNSSCAEIICTANQLVVDSAQENLVQAIPVKLLNSAYDIGVVMSTTEGWSPGYMGNLNISVYNNGLLGKYALVHLSKPDSIQYVGSDESAISATFKMVHWKIYVAPGETKEINAHFLISHVAYTNKDSVLLSVICDSLSTDIDTSNNRCATNINLDGSYDPNYKEVLSPDALNNDMPLEYKIHFQNTGDAKARQIIVADDLPAETDPETLTVLSSSHPMYTRIKGYKVEFVFENIMLPDSGTDYEGSNGYVQFRIQLVKKPSGTQFAFVKNKASIYFDYNPPVITDEAIIYARVVANTWHNNEPKTQAFVVFPNPSNKGCTISRITAAGIEIYYLMDIQGRTLETVGLTSGKYTAAFSSAPNLPAGIYFVKSNSGKTTKWIKN